MNPKERKRGSSRDDQDQAKVDGSTLVSDRPSPLLTALILTLRRMWHSMQRRWQFSSSIILQGKQAPFMIFVVYKIFPRIHVWLLHRDATLSGPIHKRIVNEFNAVTHHQSSTSFKLATGQEYNTCHGNVHCGYHRENGKERYDAHPIKQKSQKFSSNVNQSVPFTLKTFLRSATDELVARTVAHERDVATHAGDTVFAVVLGIFLHLSHAAFA